MLIGYLWEYFLILEIKGKHSKSFFFFMPNTLCFLQFVVIEVR